MRKISEICTICQGEYRAVDFKARPQKSLDALPLQWMKEVQDGRNVLCDDWCSREALYGYLAMVAPTEEG